MKATITGMGWVTPLGRDLSQVHADLLAGKTADVQREIHASSGTELPVFRIPPEILQDAAAFPRLRRSSVISHFAVAAAMEAAAGLRPDELARTALVFAASDGGVVYTRRFYGDVVERGPGSGSPLLFPETVYNAPASHVAARLGLEGESLTLVGDVEVGFEAIRTASELLACGDADHCLVVGSQELDWITCEAYARWGLTAPDSHRGAIFSEGAGAILLSRTGTGPDVQLVTAGTEKIQHQAALLTLPGNLRRLPTMVISSDSGTPFSRLEHEKLRGNFPDTPILTPKFTLGEAMACSSIQQVILAALNLRNSENGTALACATGFSGRISAVILTPHGRPA